MTAIINTTKKDDTLNFKFIYNGNTYFGWYCQQSKEFKISKDLGNSIETLGWAYYIRPQCGYPEDCEEDCNNCPWQIMDTAGWEFEDATEFLKKAGLI